MSGVYIKGAKMPTEYTGRMFIRIWPDGKADIQYEGEVGGWDTQAIEVPDHGNLIEKEQIVDNLAIAEKSVSVIQRGAETEKDIRYCQGAMVGYANSILVIDNAPVVIPAERSEDD